MKFIPALAVYLLVLIACSNIPNILQQGNYHILSECGFLYAIILAFRLSRDI